jgi:hypothetical protein
VRRLVPVFSPTERAALEPGYRYSMAQMELATGVVFKRAAPPNAVFQRACELGVLVGGAERTTHLFGGGSTVTTRASCRPCSTNATLVTRGCAGTIRRRSSSSTYAVISTDLVALAEPTVVGQRRISAALGPQSAA